MSEHHPRIDEAATVLARAKHLAGVKRLSELFGASDPDTNAKLAAERRIEGGRGPRGQMKYAVRRGVEIVGVDDISPTRGPHWTRAERRRKGKAAKLARRRNRV